MAKFITVYATIIFDFEFNFIKFQKWFGFRITLDASLTQNIQK